MPISGRQPYLSADQASAMATNMKILEAYDSERETVPSPSHPTQTSDAATEGFYGTDNWPLIQAIRRARGYPERKHEIDRAVICKMGRIMPK